MGSRQGIVFVTESIHPMYVLCDYLKEEMGRNGSTHGGNVTYVWSFMDKWRKETTRKTKRRWENDVVLERKEREWGIHVSQSKY